MPDEVDVHFDVMCPYAFQTAKWIRSARDQLGFTVNWRFFSLELVNHVEGKKFPWERDWSYGWSMLRIAVLLRREDPDLVDRWYQLAGSALHEDGKRPHRPEVARHLLSELGVDPDIVDASMADPTTHDEIRADHDRVIDAGGYGVPTLFFGDHCLFGPVLIDPPTGPAAVRLWNAVTAWTEFPDLYELQQPKTKAAQARIVDTFAPYLEARDWVSIDRGVEIGFGEDGFEAVGPADRDR